jgi:hypothetical protein
LCGSIVFKNNNGDKDIAINSSKTMYKIESDIGSGNTFHFTSNNSFTAKNFVITSGQAQIDAGAKITITTPNLGADDVFTVKSGASVIFSTAPTQKIKVEREIGAWVDDAHGWHYLSSPVASQAIQPEFVPNPPTTNEDFYKWDENTNKWINSKDASGNWNSSFESTFTVGKGYLVAYVSDVTKTFDGVTTVGDLSI